jgi:hypothetical protein
MITWATIPPSDVSSRASDNTDIGGVTGVQENGGINAQCLSERRVKGRGERGSFSSIQDVVRAKVTDRNYFLTVSYRRAINKLDRVRSMPGSDHARRGMTKGLTMKANQIDLNVLRFSQQRTGLRQRLIHLVMIELMRAP